MRIFVNLWLASQGFLAALISEPRYALILVLSVALILTFTEAIVVAIVWPKERRQAENYIEFRKRIAQASKYLDAADASLKRLGATHRHEPT